MDVEAGNTKDDRKFDILQIRVSEVIRKMARVRALLLSWMYMFTSRFTLYCDFRHSLYVISCDTTFQQDERTLYTRDYRVAHELIRDGVVVTRRPCLYREGSGSLGQHQ